MRELRAISTRAAISRTSFSKKSKLFHRGLLRFNVRRPGLCHACGS
jgi:hypothetical protein